MALIQIPANLNLADPSQPRIGYGTITVDFFLKCSLDCLGPTRGRRCLQNCELYAYMYAMRRQLEGCSHEYAQINSLDETKLQYSLSCSIKYGLQDLNDL